MGWLLSIFLAALCSSGACARAAGAEEVPPPDAAGDPKSSAEMVQREIDRRRELTFRFNELLNLAEQLYRSGEWDHAEAKYELVMRETQSQGSTDGFHRRAMLGKAKCLAAKALAKEEEGKLSEAAGLIKQAAELDPENPSLARRAQAMQESATREANPYPGNSAATQGLIEKTAEIKRLLSLADQLTETGQYRKARQKLDDVLRIDP